MAYPDDIIVDSDEIEGGTARSLKTIEWLAGQLSPLLDGIETAIASTNTKLDTLDGRVDGLEAAIGAAADAAWTAGSGSLVALQKATAAAAIDTTTASPVSVRTPCDVIAVTPTVDTAIYASGDVLFATTAIANAVRANDERAVLMSVAVIDKDDEKPAFRMLFFKANVTSGAINGAPSISDADAANYLGHIDIAAADYVDLGGVSVACQKSINLLLESASGTTTVYCFAYLTAGTPTFTAGTDLVINFGVVHS